MNFDAPSQASTLAFVVIVTAVVAAFLAGVYRAYRGTSMLPRVAFATAAWLGFVSWMVATDRLGRLPLSGLPFFFGSVAAVSIAVGLSPLGARLAAALPLAALVGFQAFRLPLELVLHAWVQQGSIPETMTWSGRNWDIVSGVVALAALPFANRHRGAAWAANIVGTILLLNVMRVALLSSPVPFGWGVTPPLVLALHFPYALIGPVCVSGALIGHIALTRALLARRQ